MSFEQLVSSRLDPHANFDGDTWVAKLVSARNEAAARLQKYVPNFEFAVTAARQGYDEVDGWLTRNRSALAAAIQASNDTGVLPDELRLQMGADRAAAFVLANFSFAAEGLGPWISGLVERVATGQAVSAVKEVGHDWAIADADRRLKVFAGIVRMDDLGELEKIFGGGQAAPAGLGAPIAIPVLVAIVVMVVGVAAVIGYFVTRAKEIDNANRVMNRMCEDALARGDTDTQQSCIQAAADIQKGGGGLFGGLLSGLFSMSLGSLVLWGAGLFITFKYVVPAIRQRVVDRRNERLISVDRHFEAL